MPVTKINNNYEFGMYEGNTHKIVPHDKCYLYPPIFKEILKSILNDLQLTTHSSQLTIKHIGFRASSDLKFILIIIVTDKPLPHQIKFRTPNSELRTQIKGLINNIQKDPTNVILGSEDNVLYGVPYIIDIIGDLKLKIHYKAFFQANTKQALNIYNDILAWIEKDETVIDAFSGVGVIGIYVAKKAKRVICIEEIKEAVESARENCMINDVKNVDIIQGLTEEVMQNLGTQTSCLQHFQYQKQDSISIIFNPPRKGLNPALIKKVAELKINKIIYLSCDPMTQKRDIKLFQDLGYNLVFLKGYDMFPHTWHIESLAVMIRG